MALVTTGYTFVNNETVTPTKLNTLVDSATVTGIQTADIADGQITLAKLVAALQQALVPAGAVQSFAMNSAPAGWLSADGSAISRTTYSGLFSSIGTTYGTGDGSTTFNIPDLRGYFLRGSGTNSDGTAAGAFGAKVVDAYASHTHGVNDPGHTHAITGTGYNGAYSVGANVVDWNGGPSPVTRSTNGSATGITIQAAGGATETRPRNIAMLYCIKF